MTSRRYKFRKHLLDKLNKTQDGGSRASDNVMKSLKTGCSLDTSHLKVKIPESIDFQQILNNNTTGGGRCNINMNILKQKGGEHLTRLDKIPEFLRNDMQSLEPAKPVDFAPNSNLPEPHKCLDLSESIEQLNENISVNVRGFPSYDINSTENLLSDHHQLQQDVGHQQVQQVQPVESVETQPVDTVQQVVQSVDSIVTQKGGKKSRKRRNKSKKRSNKRYKKNKGGSRRKYKKRKQSKRKRK